MWQEKGPIKVEIYHVALFTKQLKKLTKPLQICYDASVAKAFNLRPVTEDDLSISDLK